MGKTKETLNLEKVIYSATYKMGTYGCFEVTIGIGGDERVDYMTYDTKGIWRCYEIKVSKSDFYSKAKNSFVGNFNYYVMPKELYEEVKQDIPKHIGVYCGCYVVKKPKKVELSIPNDVLMISMIRSLYRDARKYRQSVDNNILDNRNREISRLKNQIEIYIDTVRDIQKSNTFTLSELKTIASNLDRNECDLLSKIEHMIIDLQWKERRRM